MGKGVKVAVGVIEGVNVAVGKKVAVLVNVGEAVAVGIGRVCVGMGVSVTSAAPHPDKTNMDTKSETIILYIFPLHVFSLMSLCVRCV